MSNRKTSEHSNEPSTLWNGNFIMVLVFGFIAGTATQMVNPLLSKYAVSLGATLTLAGTIFGLHSGVALLARPFSGAASDLFNRKYVMIGGILLSTVAFAGYLLFQTIAAVIIFRILQGISFAFIGVSRNAYATEFIPRERLGEGIGFASFGLILSQAVGPAIGLWISDTWGFSYVFIVSLLLTLIGAVAFLFQPYKPQVRAQSSRKKLTLKNLIAVDVIPYALLAGMFTMAGQLDSSFIALLGTERGIANVGLYFTVYSIAALVLRPISGKIADRLGLSVILYPAFIFLSLTMVLIGSAYSILFIILAGLSKSLGQGIAIPAIQSASIKRLGREHAGVVMATIHMGSDLLNTIAPPLGGFFAADMGYGNMYYAFAGIVLLGIPAFALIKRSEKKSASNNII